MKSPVLSKEGLPLSAYGEPLLKIADVNDLNWDDQADVVVLGYGGAGVCAALELAENGSSVIAVDRFAGGGATAMSGGVVYAGGTDIQRANGFEDDPVNMENYLRQEVGDAVAPATLRRFCEDSDTNLRWLEMHGVKFGTKFYPGKITYPPEGYFLQYSGNEKVEEYCKDSRPAPRGHRTAGKGFTGRYLYAALRQSADKNKLIRTRVHSTGRRLVADRTGRIVGIEIMVLQGEDQQAHQKLYDGIVPTAPFKEEKAERSNAMAREMELTKGKPLFIRATRGVILSTGGFAFNLELLQEFVPILAKNFKSLTRLGSLGDDGSGVRFGRGVGAGLAYMKTMFVGRVQSPPAAFLDGILVNSAAERFVNETVYLGTLGQAIVDQAEGEAWLILSARNRRKAIWQIFTGGINAFKLFGAPALLNLLLGGTKSATTVEHLAQKIGLNPKMLRQTVTRYDEMVAAKHDDDFSKIKDHLIALGKTSLVAINVSLANRYTFLQLVTFGGLTVNEESGAVKRSDGSIIAGLYAAGRAASGLPSKKYISGLSLSDCVFSGRRAAQACLGLVPAAATEDARPSDNGSGFLLKPVASPGE